MKKRKLDKWLKKFEEKHGITTGYPNVAGYALFNKEKSAFVSFTDGDYEPTDIYTGDLDDAFLTDNLGEAFGVMMELEDYDNISIVAVIHNELFGLSVKPGSLDVFKPD
ncbi:hypothetical protein [Enterobacter asburiae]|uniref:hypothetical protein n=1 Tax=Enterobacter asburiae TaxID=61645 RepID=UPI00399C6EC9